MSLQTDIMTALSSLGPNKVWPQAVPEDVNPPFVVYRIRNKEPETTLDDSERAIKKVVVFESYAEDYDEALTLSAQVASLIRAASATLDYFETVSPGEDYIQVIDGYMEPVYFGFWENT